MNSLKKIAFYLGLFIIVAAIISSVPYILDYQKLSDYGKGFIWGKVILFGLGGLLIFFSRWKRAPIS